MFIFFDNKTCFGIEAILDSTIIAAPSSILAVIERRHLTSSQRACLAVDLLLFYEQEAKERQATSTGGASSQLMEKIPEAARGESRDRAAKHVLVNPHYVSDAAMVKAEEFPRWN